MVEVEDTGGTHTGLLRCAGEILVSTTLSTTTTAVVVIVLIVPNPSTEWEATGELHRDSTFYCDSSTWRGVDTRTLSFAVYTLLLKENEAGIS